MNVRKIFRVIVAGTAAAMACAPLARGNNAPALAAAAVSAAASPAGDGASAEPALNYKIKPRDTVHVKVFGEEDLETTARVDKDGKIAFPLLGTAKIGGETVTEATATMEQLLREYLLKPQVSFDILAYSKEHFTILGQVNKPGTYDMPDETQVDLLEAIGMAGGFTKIANPSRILVKRLLAGRETVIKMDGKKILNMKYAGEEVPEIMPGDTIMVGEAIF
ncbi:MAG TPA: polysaccharide biosynthesis/export family protein [Chthoniobacteraceae bacterium]|nr:polysaccharide biosynthesis/export family protein [Chthoniobacteraceae bacterium]